MSRIAYYLFLKPLSLLPLPVLFRFSDVLYVVLYHLLGWRKKVVYGNMSRSFPEKSEQEIRRLMRAFYRHLCDVMVESIRMFSMSKEELIRRCRVKNPELFEKYAAEGRNIVIAAGHYNNWEMAGVGCGPQVAHDDLALYKPLSDPFMDARLRASRGRFGLELIPTKSARRAFEDYTDRLTAILFGADQSPSNPKRAYWTTFLNQDTAVMYGTEKYAREYNYVVVFGHTVKLRRGYYTLEFSTLTEHPQETAPGEISEMHTRALEKIIIENPQYWLWTHKRWKHKRPENM